MSEYVFCWRVLVAHELTGIQRQKLVSSLAPVDGAIKECFSWVLVTTPSLPAVTPAADMYLRATALHASLLKLAAEEPYQARGILRDIILTAYEEERPEMDNLPVEFAENADFPLERFRSLYLDSLLLRREDVRAYCRENEIRQVREVKGLMWENGFAAHAPQTASTDVWVIGAEIIQEFTVHAFETGTPADPPSEPISMPCLAAEPAPVTAQETPSAPTDTTTRQSETPPQSQAEPETAAAKLSIPKISQRVSTERQGNEQVQRTCQENAEAVSYVKARFEQGASRKNIANELLTANNGKGLGVVGCLIKPDSKDVAAALDHAKYILGKKAKRKTTKD